MEFTIRTLVVIVLAMIALLVFIMILSQSTGTGISLIDSVFKFFSDLIPEGGVNVNPPESGSISGIFGQDNK